MVEHLVLWTIRPFLVTRGRRAFLLCLAIGCLVAFGSFTHSNCIGTIIVVTIARTFAAMNPSWDTAADVFTLFRVDALAMGALLAITLNSTMTHMRIRKIAWIAALVLFPMLIGVALTGKRFLGVPNTLLPTLFHGSHGCTSNKY